MTDKFSHWVIRFRVAIILVTVVIVALTASGARYVEFSNDYRAFFSPENPQLQASRRCKIPTTKPIT